MKRVVSLFALSMFVSAGPAYAYLDPGTGSLLLQGLIAAIAAGMGAITILWSRIKAFFGMGAEMAEPSSGNAAIEEDKA